MYVFIPNYSVVRGRNRVGRKLVSTSYRLWQVSLMKGEKSKEVELLVNGLTMVTDRGFKVGKKGSKGTTELLLTGHITF